MYIICRKHGAMQPGDVFQRIYMKETTCCAHLQRSKSELPHLPRVTKINASLKLQTIKQRMYRPSGEPIALLLVFLFLLLPLVVVSQNFKMFVQTSILEARQNKQEYT